MKVTIDGKVQTGVKRIEIEEETASSGTPGTGTGTGPGTGTTPGTGTNQPPSGPITPVVPAAGLPTLTPLMPQPELMNIPIGNSNIANQIRQMGRDQMHSLKFARADLAGKYLTLMQLSHSICAVVSNKPYDFGPDNGGLRQGCIDNLGQGGTGDKTINVSPAPADIDGFLYVNIRWWVWDNFGSAGKRQNYCLSMGSFTFRRD